MYTMHTGSHGSWLHTIHLEKGILKCSKELVGPLPKVTGERQAELPKRSGTKRPNSDGTSHVWEQIAASLRWSALMKAVMLENE